MFAAELPSTASGNSARLAEMGYGGWFWCWWRGPAETVRAIFPGQPYSLGGPEYPGQPTEPFHEEMRKVALEISSAILPRRCAANLR